MEVDSRPNAQNPSHEALYNEDEHYLVMHNKTLKCVCQLCTCGKHHCPRPRVKGNFSTSYADSYKDIKIVQPTAPRPEYKYEQRHYNPEAMKTSYQDTYIKPSQPANMDSPSRLQSVGSKILNHVPFIGSSSYKDQYQPFVIKANNPQDFQAREQKLEKAPMQNYRPPQVKFEGVSSYKSQYMEPPKAASKPIPQATYQKMQIPFYGQSSYKNDFPQYQLQRAPVQQNNYMTMSQKVPTVKFQGSTSYKDQYKGYEMRAPEQDLSRSMHQCAVQKLHVPSVNYINDKQHIYYDPESNKFV